MYNIMTKYGATFTSPVFFTSFHFFHFLHFPGLHSSFIFFGPSFSVFVFIKPTCSVVGNAASLRQWKEQYSQFVDKELSEFRVFFQTRAFDVCFCRELIAGRSVACRIPYRGRLSGDFVWRRSTLIAWRWWKACHFDTEWILLQIMTE